MPQTNLKPGMWAPPSQNNTIPARVSPTQEGIINTEDQQQQLDHPPIWGPKAVFKVNGAQEQPVTKPRPGTWAPDQHKVEVLSTKPLNNVSVQQLDGSVNMTIALSPMVPDDVDKENVRPLAKIPKYKMPGDAQGKFGVWQPSVRPASPPPRYADPDLQKPPPLPELVYKLPERSGPAEEKNKLPPLTPEISRIIHADGADSDTSAADSMSTGGGSKSNKRRTAQEKVFSDSAFYADPNNTFPTVEEQMKMAKRVAVSLMAPANEKARGHQMFMKRKRKSDKWTTESTGLSGEKSSSGGDLANIADFDEFDDPNKPLFTFRIPKLATRKPNLKPIEKTVLSKQDVEDVRLHEKRNMHNTVAPQVCFSIAEALQSTKGKGGKIFAKRRAKSDSWVVDESNVKSPPGPVSAGLPSQNRLKELSEAAKARVTPWQAALEDPTGDVDAAFDHLTSLRRSKDGSIFDNLQEAALQKQKQQVGPPSWMKESTTPIPVTHLTTSSQNDSPAYRDFNNKIKGWGMDTPRGGKTSVSLIRAPAGPIHQSRTDSQTLTPRIITSHNVAARGWGRGPPSAQCDRPLYDSDSDEEISIRKVEFQKSPTIGVFDVQSLVSSMQLKTLSPSAADNLPASVGVFYASKKKPEFDLEITNVTKINEMSDQSEGSRLTYSHQVDETRKGKDKENLIANQPLSTDAPSSQDGLESCASKETTNEVAASVQVENIAKTLPSEPNACVKLEEIPSSTALNVEQEPAASEHVLDVALDIEVPKENNSVITEQYTVVADSSLETSAVETPVSLSTASADVNDVVSENAVFTADATEAEDTSLDFTLTLANDSLGVTTLIGDTAAELVAGFETGNEGELDDLISDL